MAIGNKAAVRHNGPAGEQRARTEIMMNGVLTYEKLMESVRLMQSLSGPPASTGLLSGGAYNNFGAMRIFSDPGMVEQFRFPRAKGKRIRNKWKKNARNFRASRHALIDQQRGNIYCHPTMCAEIKRQVPGAR